MSKKKRRVPSPSLTNSAKPKVSGTFWLILVLALLATVVVVEMVVIPWRQQEAQRIDNPLTQYYAMNIGEQTFQVEIRDDDAERSLGLSSRETLDSGHGMVFLFTQPDRPLFWMKDMKFGLDVVWIKDNQVVQVQENIPPPTDQDPTVRTMIPATPIDMVLELPAGTVQSQGIQVGDTVQLNR